MQPNPNIIHLAHNSEKQCRDPQRERERDAGESTSDGVAAVERLFFDVSVSGKRKPANAALPQHQRCIVSGAASQHVSYRPTRKLVVAEFRMPDKAKMQMNAVKEQLWKSLPVSVKEFPWKKAEEQVLKRLLSLSQKVFKWSFIAWFFLSFPSDILFAMSRNQELVMPFGLFAGCFLADFTKETSEELFQQTEVKNGNLVGIACVFVILKLISVLFGVRGQVFLLHMANGGLMQIL